MDLSTLEIFMTIGIFLQVTFILIKFTYRRFEKEYGAKAWKLDGSRAGYFRVMGLLSITITVVLILILKSTILH